MDPELATWAPAGREVRPGTWAQQARPTPDVIEEAVADGRLGDAARLARHLVVEAQEIHDLYTAWAREIPAELQRRGVAATERSTETCDPEAEWAAFGRAIEAFAQGCEAGAPSVAALDEALETWRAAHDRHRDVVAGWIDVAVALLGEDRLGDLWRTLQADGIAAYARYDLRRTRGRSRARCCSRRRSRGCTATSAARGAAARWRCRARRSRGAALPPCGSGGRIRQAERFGVTTERHDWAWNATGVCHYCVHCCVLQQLEPIDHLGYPARVIDPPLQPGDACTWTVYDDPSLVPEDAYRRVGRRKPGSRG